MWSCNQVPVMPCGTIAPEGRTTLPSALHLHLLMQMNSITTSHSWMKCPVPPQKLQLLLPGALIPVAATPVLRGLAPAGWDCIAVLNISPREVITAIRGSVFAEDWSMGGLAIVVGSVGTS